MAGIMLWKQPHYEAELEDWLQHRAAPQEAALFKRYTSLIKQACGTTSSRGAHSAASLHARATQQQQRRCSSAAAAGAAAASAPWGHATTAAAAAAAAAASRHAGSAGRPLRDSAGPARHARGRPGSAAAVPALNLPLPAGPPRSSGAAAGRPEPLSPSYDHQHPQQPQPLQQQQQPDLQALSAWRSAATVGARSVYVTTSAAMHGLAELYPDLWRATVPICRPDPAPNRNFVSEWAASLAQGAREASRRYMATTSQLANLQAAKPTDEFAVRADDALVAWAAKQHTYSADLLAPGAEAVVTALLSGGGGGSGATGSCDSAACELPPLSLSERKELLQVLRQAAAVVQPNRAKSASHVAHCRQESVEQPATTALLKAQTRIRTMGQPRQVAVKGFRAPAAAAAATAHSAGGGGSCSLPDTAQHALDSGAPGSGTAGGVRQAAPRARACDMVDTQKSRVPLKWAASSILLPGSSYTATFGAHPGRSPQMLRTRFREVNVALGHVDPVLHPPGSRVYPVEALYLSLPAKHMGATAAARHDAPGGRRQDAKTTHRACFPGH